MTDFAGRRPWLRRAVTLEYFSVVWMAGEGIAGFLSGVAAQSLALEVFALDSFIEIVSALVVLWRMRLEFRTGDSREGEAQTKVAERRAAFVVAACLLALAAYILAGIVDRVRTRTVPTPGIVGFVVAIAAIIVMPGLWRSKRQTAERLQSEALQEDGIGNLVCGCMAVILLFGLIAARVGWWWADPVASLGLGVFVAREGWEALQHVRLGIN